MRLKPITDTFKAYKYASSQIIIPSRNKAFKYVPGRFSEKGTNSSKRKPKYPTNWRDVNFNPPNIPSDWKPEDYEKNKTIDYDYEKKLAEYIPGYKPKIPEKEMTNYNEEKCFISNEQHYACNGVKQIMILTKSVFMDDEAGDKKLPDLLYGLSDQLWSDEQYQKTIDVMQNVHLFDFDPDTVHKYRNTWSHSKLMKVYDIPIERKCNLMTWELIRLSNGRALKLNKEYMLNKMFIENLPTSSSYIRANVLPSDLFIPDLPENWKIQLKSKAAVQILSKKPLKNFADPIKVEKSTEMQIPNTRPALAISDIPASNLYEFINKSGLSDDNKLLHTHTIIEYNLQELEEEEFHGKMLKSCFNTAYSRAQQLNLVNEDGSMKKSLSVQCVGTDSQHFDFMCFQLNTAQLMNDEGVKNMVWTSKRMKLFEECSPKTWTSPEYYHGFCPETFKLFQAVVLNGIY